MASKSMIAYKRRLEVKKEYLKGKNIEDMAFQFDVAESTIRSDIRKINNEYIKQVQNNPHILEKQAEYILRHLDELKLIKSELYKINETANNKQKISALKAILDELSQEARILKLIDVTTKITNYIHIDKLSVMTKEVISIIKEFVPTDVQRYALERLRGVSSKIVDAEYTDKTDD